MEVIIHSNISGAVGTVVIPTDVEQTVDSLIKAFCREKRISGRSDLVLTNCRQTVLEGDRKLAVYAIKNGEELYMAVHNGNINGFYFFKDQKCN